uniref:Uncharacterized protein n=2 Tax=Picea TaxID=3328 RepID=A0A101LW27_PICGL|nr:hypothetical protein ABT39_MTgene1494 [Picea glauca]QHR92657.1 hypothetical protein Q903MT_gene6705 [Picea sitchensis]
MDLPSIGFSHSQSFPLSSLNSRTRHKKPMPYHLAILHTRMEHQSNRLNS